MLLRTTAIAACALVLPLRAQDSVSTSPCVPGDAPTPWEDASSPNGSQQRLAFAVDLSAIQTSWGKSFGLAPLLKSSKTSTAFFTSILSAQAFSRSQLLGVPYSASSYQTWNTLGQGVNKDPSLNDPGTPVSKLGQLGHQQAAAFAEFATTDGGASSNQIIGGLINLDPANPARLWVERVVAASNSCDTNSNFSQFGLGGVDGAGNVHLRFDSFNSTTGGCAGLTPAVANNYLRVKLAARNAALQNVVSNDYFPFGGLFDVPATELLVTQYSAGTLITPVVGKQSPLGAPLFLGSDSLSQFVHGSAFGTLSLDQAHLASGTTGTRGTLSYSEHSYAFLGNGSGGTCAILGQGSEGSTRRINLWGVDALGATSGTQALVLPTIVTDNDDGFTNLMPGSNSFAHYYSQVIFRGGNGMVALTRDQAGRLLVAAVVDQPSGNQVNEKHYIAVARLDPLTGVPAWTMAAWNDGLSGKLILDGPNGNAIGRQVTLDDLSGGSANLPSISCPMLDSVGNVWFLSAIEVFDPLGGASTFTVGLLRSVYDPASFAYQLELVFKTGDVIASQGTGLNYQLGFMQIDDSNSIGSGTAFSGNISEVAHLSRNTVGLATSDPRTLGGLVISAEVVYDWNNDAAFDQCSGGGPSTNQDQDYNVLLYLGATSPEADVDGNGVADKHGRLSADKAALSLSAGGTAQFALDIGEQFAGQIYFLLGSVTGTSPGLAIDGLVLPLNFDGYFLNTLTYPNAAPLTGSFGFTAASGQATALFTLPAGTSASLAGVTVHHAFATISFTGIPQTTSVSNAWPLVLGF